MNMNMHPEFLLNQIQSPKDLKKLSIDELTQLASEIRTLILEKDAKIGGHLSPDLGIVELTIAYHYVFDAPEDKIIWDISHQTYPHKMLTGRAFAWLDPDKYEDVTPYTNPEESPYDYFALGHTSASIALATGMAKARDLRGGNENIMALIGDGSMTGGVAFEGLNNAAIEKHNLVVVLNDNQWSIDENVGGMVKLLADLRASNGQAQNNPFKAMGFDYRYEAKGNDIASMIKAFEAVKDVDHPILLHVNTLKGKGYEPALQSPGTHHWVAPFNLEDDSPKFEAPAGPTANSVALDVIKDAIDQGQKVLAINAAIPGAFGLSDIKQNYPDNYVDVGIAEQESISFAAGAVKNGVTPVVFQNSTFLQRAFDQLSHDVAANELPIVMFVSASINGGSKTHLGNFDQVMISNLPNWIYLAPTTLAEEKAMLTWALNQKDNPVAIKKPARQIPVDGPVLDDYAKPAYQVKLGKDIAILALGSMYHQVGVPAAKELGATVVNPVSANILDTKTLDELAASHRIIITLEDNAVDGGFGQKVASYLGDRDDILVKNYGALREYTDQVSGKELLDRYHLTPKNIVNDAKVLLEK
ncbi:1-deoxy-d-xylulose-5-phosphate synthase 2 [Ligilactobacillus hayakitensis DSM 18933 = JCM 14209]|uniref:1-deoxy-D-xylulose-5-phosphate synthase n=2 Tax=Ligilactobacillus TaxID=2767887 RepID=A0A0R1WP51_9LACO|nr:1-deoxy-d-xylulose-5-phosphate synthase 2 [Ligilactobacillus hayakitensis DSM 18933 = JCM 14209]